MSTTVTGSKRHLNINADEFAGDLNGTVNTATTATTQSTSDNSTKVATTAFVKAQGYAVGTIPTFSTVGAAFRDLGDVSVVSYVRVNADETLSYLNAAQFLSAIGGTGNTGTVTSVGTGNIHTLSVSGTTAVTLTPNVGAVTNGGGNLATGDHIYDHVTSRISGLASTSYVDTSISNLIDNAPENLNTLNELAEALNDDDDAIVTINTALAARLPLAGGTMSGDIILNDNVELEFGTGSDVKMKFNGSDFVTTVPSGSAFLVGTNGGTPNDNNGNADFVIDVNADPQISWYSGQLQVGGTNMNWEGRISATSSLFNIGAWDRDVSIHTQGSSGASAKSILIRPQATDGAQTEVAEFNGDNGVTLKAATKITGGSLSITADGSNATVMAESGAGDFEINTVGDMILDAGGGDIHLRDDGTTFGTISNSSSNLWIAPAVQDKDIVFRGNDNGSYISALTLDMSEGGNATFAGTIDSSHITSIGTVKGQRLQAESSSFPQQFIIDSTSGGGDSRTMQIGMAGTSLYLKKSDATGSVIFRNSNNTDLMTIGLGDSGQVTVLNELEAGSLDINGNADISGNLTGLDNVTSDNYYINDTNTRLHEGVANSVKITTNSGNLQIGPQNSSWCHMYTDRANFYFNTGLTVDGGLVQSYNEDLVLRRAGSNSHQLTIRENVAEFTGEVEASSLDINGNADISGTLTVGNTITTPANTNLSLSPNGSGHVYFGNSGNGMNLYHYSSANDGKYATYDFNGNYYRVSTTATSGVWINDPLRVDGALDINGNVDISSSLNVSGELNMTGNSDKYIDVETLADSDAFTIRHHNPTGNLFETAFMSIANGTSYLYYDGSYKLRTFSWGVDITGELEADSLDIDGNANIAGNLDVPNHTITALHVTADQLNLKDRGDYITFYGGDQAEHSISSRDSAGDDTADDLRINSYGSLYINLDSNNNNTSAADFVIGRHGGAAGTMTLDLLTLSGENGKLTVNGEVEATSLDINGSADISGALTLGTVLAASEGGTGLSSISTLLNSNVTLSSLGAAASSHTHTFASLTSKPTTISGYGITDAFDGAYGSLTGTPTIPSGNQIIDWTAENAGTIHTSNFADANTNYYLDGITKSGNTLTFSVNGTTNRTYTFGSNAFNSTTIPSGNAVIDWTQANAGTIHASNFNDNDTNTFRTIEVDTSGNNSADSTLTASETLRFKKGSNITLAESGGVITISSTDTNTQNDAATTRAFFSGSGINTSTGVITNTTYTKASSSSLGLVKIGEGVDIDAQGTISVTVQTNASGSSDGLMSSSDKTKIDNIESNADVTDATNVAAAGASMKTSTETISGTKTFSAAVTVSNSTASTSKTTGAVKVTGGIGISGALNVGGDVTAFASSDKRYKDNLQVITNPIDKVKSLTGYTFTWNDKHEQFNGSDDIGVVAQEVEKVFPEIVDTRDNGYKAVKYEKMVAVLIEAVKDQQKQIDELKAMCNGCSN